MERKDLKLVGTKLNRIIFEEEYFESELNFTLTVNNSITNKDEHTKIKLTGELSALNSKEEIALTIEMETLFKLKGIFTEEEIDKFDEESDNYLSNGLLNELTLMLGNITGKAYKSPIIIPFIEFKKEKVRPDNEDK